MTTPVPVVQGSVISPAAVAGAQPSAAFGLGQVLKEIIHSSPQAFKSENEILGAVNAVDKFIKAFVPVSALPALHTGDQRAPVEDVSLRTPPPGTAITVPANYPVIDYDKLAMALVRAQAAVAAETVPVTSVPAPAAETPVPEVPQYG